MAARTRTTEIVSKVLKAVMAHFLLTDLIICRYGSIPILAEPKTSQKIKLSLVYLSYNNKPYDIPPPTSLHHKLTTYQRQIPPQHFISKAYTDYLLINVLILLLSVLSDNLIRILYLYFLIIFLIFVILVFIFNFYILLFFYKFIYLS